MPPTPTPNTQSQQSQAPDSFPLGPREFIAMMAALMALNALAIDAMLPAFPAIGEALNIARDNDRQFLISIYLLGMGVGSLFYGPLSDRYGRRPILLTTLVLYSGFAVASAFSPSFGFLLAMRLAQGLAAAAMGVLVVSVIRDRYSGDVMARYMSLIFIIFMAVPVIAPTIGQLILYVSDWRAIFLLFAIAGGGVWLWVWLRLPETLSAEHVIPIRPSVIVRIWSKVIFHRQGLGYVSAASIIVGALFGFLNSAQQIFSEVFDAQALFPFAFAMVAASMAVTNWFNSRIVERFGARRVSHSALICFIVLSLVQLATALLPHEPMAMFLVIIAANMSMVGFLGSNFGSIAMEPFGAMAGAASSFQSFLRTVVAAIIGAVIGQFFNMTTIPLASGFVICGVLALLLILWAEKGRLFRRPGTCPNSPL